MDWRLKCLAFHTVARIPAIYRFLQRRTTGRYFLTVTDPAFEAYSYHIRNFTGGVALEFGAGGNLLCPLLLSHAGATQVLALDIKRLASVDRINHVIHQLRMRLPGNWPDISDLAELATLYRIRYMAPADARATGLAPASIDFICSTSTLEHIPPEAIRDILAECRRISSPHAVCSFIVDYHDHYATADPAITRFNFYKYPDWQWRVFNPGNHFQNRLRHSDYIRLFRAFQQVEAMPVIPNHPPITVKLTRRFRRYSAEDLVALNGRFLLRAHGLRQHVRRS